MKMRSVTPMRIAKIGTIVLSILFCAAGVALIALPDISSAILGVCAGVALLLFGAVRLVGFLSRDLYRLAFQYDLEIGILLLILGAILLLRPERLMVFLSIAFGVAILLDGLFKIRIAMDSKAFGIKGWGVILALAILTGVVGVALIFDSAVGAQLLSICLGVSLFSEGVLNLYTVLATVRIVKHQLPDGFDEPEESEG